MKDNEDNVWRNNSIIKHGCFKTCRSRLRSEIKSFADIYAGGFRLQITVLMLEFRVCLWLCSYMLQIRSRHSLDFSNCLSSPSASQSLSVHFPAGETSVISQLGVDEYTRAAGGMDRRFYRPGLPLAADWQPERHSVWWRMSLSVTGWQMGKKKPFLKCWRACGSMCLHNVWHSLVDCTRPELVQKVKDQSMQM